MPPAPSVSTIRKCETVFPIMVPAVSLAGHLRPAPRQNLRPAKILPLTRSRTHDLLVGGRRRANADREMEPAPNGAEGVGTADRTGAVFNSRGVLQRDAEGGNPG